MTTSRKICIVTGSRAEYGLLYWLMKEIASDPDLTLQIVATGMHLSPEFGLTYRQLEADGFTIDAKVEMLLSSDSPVGIAKSIGLGVNGFADSLDRLKPDIMVVLGDRFEIFAAAQAAMVARIPIGIANNAVGSGPKLIPRLCRVQVPRIVIMAPKDINSPWAKLEKRRTP